MNHDILDIIIREYDEQMNKNKEEREERIKKVYDKIPEIKEIDNQVATIGRNTLNNILNNPDNKDAKKEMEDKFNILKQRKKELLLKNNIPIDYSELKYRCNICKDTGYVEGVGRCKCFMQRMIDILYERSNMGELLKRQNFNSFDDDYYEKGRIKGYENSPYENILYIKKFCKEFCDNFDEPSKSLLFHGDTGLGKTFMSSCIAKEIMDKGYTVIYIRAIRLFKLFDDERFGRINENIDWLYDCDLLIIDDLGTEISTKNNTPYLLDLINERIDNGKKIIINTNNNFDGLEKLYTKRFTSRLMEKFNIMNFYGDDIRRQKLFNKK